MGIKGLKEVSVAVFLVFLILTMPVSFVSSLTIRNVTVVTTSNSAVVKWNTDDIASGIVDYGLRKGMPDLSSNHDGFTNDHSVNLAGLEDGKVYYFDVRSINASGTEKKDINYGNYYSFATKDITPPGRVLNVKADKIGLSYVTLKWDNTKAGDFLRYAVYRNGVNILNTTLANCNDIGLNADTTYRYTVAAVDISGNIGETSQLVEVRTLIPDYKQPEVFNISITEVHATYAKIRWITDEPSNSIVYFGLNANLEGKLEKNESVTEHIVQIEGLLDNTPYYYKVVSCDASGNCGESTKENFKAGEDSGAPTIQMSLPDYYNSNRIAIRGKTESFSKVSIYINDELRRAVSTDDSGYFFFTDVGLDTAFPSAKIKVVSIDPVGFESFYEKEVQLDTQPPVINVTQLTKYTTKQDIIIGGTVDEEVILNINLAKGGKKVEFLPKVTGLRVVKLEGNSVELTWDEINSTALKGYIIYRNGKRMTDYSDNHFIDPALNKSAQYSYEVSAYDDKCTEGEKSDALTITAPYNAALINDYFIEEENTCSYDEPEYRAMTVKGRFSQTIKLESGKNFLIINATDKAGNSAVIEQETTVDVEKPEILETNLDSLNPSYIQDVTIKGKVKKTAGQNVVVKITVNDDDEYSSLAEEDGTFSVDISLERDVVHHINETQDYDPEGRQASFSTRYGEGFTSSWTNEIKITAKSESGLESDPVVRGILLANCGYGSWWRIDVDEASPSILTPRLMLEGFAQIGIPVNSITWQGGMPNGTISYVEVVQNPPISDIDKKLYDLDWIQNIEYTASADNSKGYLQITLKKLDSASFITESKEAKKDGKNEATLTTLDMENILTEHRLNDKDCKVAGFGCIRIPIMLDIAFSTTNGSQSTYLYGDRREIVNTHQRQCWDVEIAIDRRLPSDKIPEEFLKSTVTLLNQSITTINQILKPLNAIKEVVFYSCAGTIVIDFVMAFQESYNCDFSSALSAFTTTTENGKKQDNWRPYDAHTGQCDKFQDEQKAACDKCAESYLALRNFEKTMRWVCDRIFCPSAPTIQNYVREEVSDRGQKLWTTGDNKKVFQSDCAQGAEPTEPNKGFPNSEPVLATYDKVKEWQTYYEKAKNSEADDPFNCKTLHVPNEKCCGVEYMEQWDSSCMIMDELTESKCIAYYDQKGANKVPDPDCGTLRKLWNSAAGFCEPDGEEPAKLLQTTDSFKNEIVGLSEDKNYVYVAGEGIDKIWFRFLPDEYGDQYLSQRTTTEATGRIYAAEAGYITGDVTLAEKTFTPGEPSKVSSQRVFMPVEAGKYFYIDTGKMLGTSATDEVFNEFLQNYKTITNSGDIQIRKTYRLLQEKLGVSDKQYVVDPTSGFLRSMQCVCLPGITSYLNLWKRVLEAVKLCVDTVLKTGDGSPGVCKAILSIYVCDLVYDLISCFFTKYTSNTDREYGGGLGSFLGALTSAGNKVSRSVSNRYGESSIWKSIFAERKIVHAVCLWAFTGTWDFDVGAVLEEDISTDVQTISFLYPCTRRYISFDPARDGLTTYNYHVALGMVAGSQINYQVDLVCSDDYSCSTPTGECDCINIGKQTRRITLGPGFASRGQTISEEIYQNVKDADYRYDKAIVRWISADSNKNGEAECKLQDVGSKAPAFCKLEAVQFRCNLGFDEENYIRFYNDPIPVFSSGKDVYTVDENVRVALRMTQKQPREASEKYAAKEINPYTKFMQMQLFNKDGVELHSSQLDQIYNFNGNGMSNIDELPNYRITADDFRKTKSSLIVEGPVRSHQLEDDKISPVYRDVHIIIQDTDGKFVAEERTYVGNSLNIKTVGSGQVTMDNKIFFDHYQITMSRAPQKGDDIHVVYQASSVTSDTCTSELQHWKLKVTFYDKLPDIDEKSEQVSTYQGQQVTRVIDIPVRCSNTGANGLKDCPLGKVTMPCVCGSMTCNPTKNESCNLYGRELRCENVTVTATPPVNNPPQISNVRFTDRLNLIQTVAEGTTYDVQGDIVLTFDATDDLKVNSAKVLVGGREAQLTQILVSTYQTRFVASMESPITITATDSNGVESAQYKFTLKPK